MVCINYRSTKIGITTLILKVFKVKYIEIQLIQKLKAKD